MTPINFKTGELMASQSVWMSNDNTPASVLEPRTQIRALEADIPTRFHGHSVVDSDKNQFIQFDTTAAKKDVRKSNHSPTKKLKLLHNLWSWLETVYTRISDFR